MSDKIYEKYKKIAEDNLLKFLPEVNSESEILYKSMVYSLKAGGKRLRPVITLAACIFADEKSEMDLMECLPFALGIEYIHTYSLIHDDLPAMDNDTLRRGKPTNHVVFGEDIAILAGDGLLNAAFESMAKDLTRQFNNHEMMIRKVKAMEAIGSASGCKGMVAGQIADVESEGKKISDKRLDYINENKTGAMIIGAIRAGAYIGGGSDEVLQDLTEYAKNIGLAFQIRDDILDVIGDEKQLGKNIGSDQRQDKSTYVSIHGLKYSENKLKEVTELAKECLKKYGERADFFLYLADKLVLRKS